MGRFPVFQSPELDEAQCRMKPCDGFVHGFLGEDPRCLADILNADQALVAKLGLSHERIAQKLTQLSEEANKGLGAGVETPEGFVLQAHAARGKIPCPFGHPGLFPKIQYTLVNERTGEKLAWTDLSIHLISEHGFYQGHGSPFRLDPEKIQSILNL